MSEFTGERVIPGQVNDDLWAEHFSRYAFAARLAGGRRALDIGCGTGYGTAELSHVSSHATGCDSAAAAIDYAQLHFAGPEFVRASGTALPFASASFGLITAFEVIEHLEDWPVLLQEAARVLAPGGIFLVSTPNKLYYAESRAEHGPNPFHQHEFVYAEFRDALSAAFRHQSIFLQNHAGAFAIYPADHYAAAEAVIESTSGSPDSANFFLALCSQDPISEPPALLYAPKATNILRERERHIRLLQTELSQNNAWLAETVEDRQQLLQKHAQLGAYLEKQNDWAQELERNWKDATQRIAELQQELIVLRESYERQITTLEEENQSKTQWALDTESRLSTELLAQTAELRKTVRLLDKSEATVVERTEWARQLLAELQSIRGQVAMMQHSRWIRLGRTLGLGPNFRGNGRTQDGKIDGDRTEGKTEG